MTLDEAIITMDVHISGRSQRIERAWNVIHAALVDGQKPTTNSAMDAIPALVSRFVDEHMFGMREREALQYFGRWSQEQHQ